jgi:hypothetical protein
MLSGSYDDLKLRDLANLLATGIGVQKNWNRRNTKSHFKGWAWYYMP